VSDAQPTSTKPYFIRAIHEWCSDNGLTPYLAVSVTDQVRVPREHVRNGEIVLNVGLLATDKLQIGNDSISFQARFSGRVQDIFVPIDNVVAIYARETGNGMAFDVPKPLAETGSAPGHLRPPELVTALAQDTSGSAQSSVADDSAMPGESPPDDAPSTPPRSPDGRPRLTRVK
jgi:stringent starvation protein B